jgi:hypothetical protein
MVLLRQRVKVENENGCFPAKAGAIVRSDPAAMGRLMAAARQTKEYRSDPGWNPQSRLRYPVVQQDG